MVSRKRRPMVEPPPPAPQEEQRPLRDGGVSGPAGNGDQGDESDPSSSIPSPSRFSVRPILPKNGRKGIKKKERALGDEDDVALLKQMARSLVEKGSGPGALESLGAEVPRQQVVEKGKSLKRKHSNNVEKEGEGKGEFSKKPREVEVLQPSRPDPKRRRGGEGDNKVGVVFGLASSTGSGLPSNSGKRQKRARNERAVVAAEEEKVKGGEMLAVEEEKGAVPWEEEFPLLAGWLAEEGRSLLGEGGLRFLKEGWMGEDVGKEKMTGWEEKWRELRKEELRLFLRRRDLIHEQVKFVVDGIKSKPVHENEGGFLVQQRDG